MPILETWVVQEDECIVRVICCTHNIEYYINMASNKPVTKDYAVFKIPDDFVINLKKSPPFKILCVYTNDLSAERIFQLIEDIEERILMALEKKKELTVHSREALHDYVEKLVNYYSDQRRLTQERLKEEMKDSYEVIIMNTEDLEKNQGRSSAKKKSKVLSLSQAYRGRKSPKNPDICWSAISIVY